MMMTHWVETCGTQQKQNIVFVINTDVVDCIINTDVLDCIINTDVLDCIINTDVLDCIIKFIDIIPQYLPAETEESHETVRTACVRLRYKLATTES